MRTSSTKNSLIIGISIVLGASLLSVGVSNAAGTTIKACAKKSGGAMRLIDSNKNCKKSERTLTWGTQGDAGATGATGAAGSTGATGANGLNGADATAIFGTITSSGSVDTTKTSAATISSVKDSTGLYIVTFNRDIRACSVVATVFPQSAGFNSTNHVVAWPDTSGTDHTVINFYVSNASNALVDLPFSYALFCK
jgi:hypothetical protein